MKDWTTGFGFYECSFGTKHVYDDLCICEPKEENKICSTDLFNYNEKFINVMSDDLGIIKKIKCDCGIYGNVLEKFTGKTFECLVSTNGTKYSANYISNALNRLPFELFQYEIIQNKEKNIQINSSSNLSDIEVLQLAGQINFVLNKQEDFSVFNNNKMLKLNINSGVCVRFVQKNPKLYNNKIISVRSDCY
jgi:phenylacetate-coenzyme A ligase PaaK-like adenylate-forming protein